MAGWNTSLGFNVASRARAVTLSPISGLTAHIRSQINSRLAGKSAASAKPLFTTQDHAAPAYVRNPNFWAADAVQKLTCISPWNAMPVPDNGVWRAGCLVTPRHVVEAHHFETPVGTLYRFITADNQIVTRTAVQKIDHPLDDLAMFVLDSDVPASITPAKVLPPDADLYLHGLDYPFPAIVLDQEEKGLVQEVWQEFASSIFQLATRTPTDAKQREFYEDTVGGDSGDPVGTFINDEFVLLYCVFTGSGAGSGEGSAGPYLLRYYDYMNTTIAALDALAGISTGYTVTPIDLSAFSK